MKGNYILSIIFWHQCTNLKCKYYKVVFLCMIFQVICLLHEDSNFSIFTVCFTWRSLQCAKNKTRDYVSCNKFQVQWSIIKKKPYFLIIVSSTRDGCQLSHQCQLTLNNGRQRLAVTTNVFKIVWNRVICPHSLKSGAKKILYLLLLQCFIVIRFCLMIPFHSFF